ncbi:MAG: TonB-dependent receptor [Proteobacteria bacterium]|nr:TonB-dependent receptor [Pseudomonadota bacterium]MBU1058268.1 TonB-dependent receptor [Pseudomonadota bacterium]
MINIITRTGDDIDGGRITTETGSHNRHKGYIEYGKVLANGLDIAGSHSGLQSDGEKSIYFPERDQVDYGFNNGVASGVDDEDAYKGSLKLSYKDWQFLVYSSKRTKTVPTAAWDGSFNDSGMYTIDEQTSFEVNYHTTLFPEKNGQLAARLYHDTFAYSGEYPFFEEGGWSGTYITNKDESNSKQWGMEIRYSMDISEKLAVTAGVEYVDVYEINQKNWDVFPNYALTLDTGTKNNTYHNRACYAQGEYVLVDDLRLLAGIRLDDYSTAEEQWSPRVALLYSPYSATTLKLLYGEAFRAPNNYEKFYDDGGWQIGNEELLPEEIKTWEFVWEQKLFKHTRLVSSLYRFDIENLIVQVEDTALQFQNTSKVRSDGAEIHLESHFANDMKSHLGMSWVDTTYYDDDRGLDNSPTVSASGGISIPLFSKKNVHIT